jgi:beta-galactosidase
MLSQSWNDDWHVAIETPGRERPLAGPFTLPRDMMILEKRNPDCPNGNSTGFHPGGRYRYTKKFIAPSEWSHKRVVVEFESIYHRSVISVNGRHAGSRANGYLPIFIVLDDFLVYGQENTIEVLADTSAEPTSRWYTGSGIYRPIHLHLASRSAYILPLGFRCHTTKINATSAQLELTLDVGGADLSEIHFAADFYHSREAVNATVLESGWSVLPGKSGDRRFRQLVSIESPLLWSPDSPNLYEVDVRVSRQNTLLDSVSDDVGILLRTMDARSGFRINGNSCKLRGACIHSDHGIIGANTYEEAEIRRVRLLKASGYNAIRNSHNPASRAMLRECDRQGIIVMDELADEWRVAKAPSGYNLDFEDNWEQDLKDMISWGYNRPCIAMWSIGNEIPETASTEGVELSKAMSKVCRDSDTTRFSVLAVNGLVNMLYGSVDLFSQTRLMEQDNDGNWVKKEKKAAGGSAVVSANTMAAVFDRVVPYLMTFGFVTKKITDAMNTTDIAGYNYMQTRYPYDVKTYPDRVILGTETHPTVTDKIWADVEKYPSIIGDFAWTAWDYLGEIMLANVVYGQGRSDSMTYPALASGESIIDLIGHRQTQSYFNEIIWGLRSRPLLAVRPMNHWNETPVPSTWRLTDSQQSWSWEGYEGKTATVEVYSGHYRVELLLNGRKVGSGWTGPKYRYRTVIKTPYQPGTLVAISFDAKGNETGRDELVSADSGNLVITAIPEKSKLISGAEDVVFIPINLTDESGTVRPLSDRRIKVVVEGSGELLGLGTAASHTEETYYSGEHTTYYGRALAVVRSGLEKGQVKVTITGEDMLPVTISLDVV